MFLAPVLLAKFRGYGCSQTDGAHEKDGQALQGEQVKIVNIQSA